MLHADRMGINEKCMHGSVDICQNSFFLFLFSFFYYYYYLKKTAVSLPRQIFVLQPEGDGRRFVTAWC